jgi:hypothetical protein
LREAILFSNALIDNSSDGIGTVVTSFGRCLDFGVRHVFLFGRVCDEIVEQNKIKNDGTPTLSRCHSPAQATIQPPL